MTAISRSRGRRAVRTALAVGAVSLGLAAVTACEKPSPHAQFTVGTVTRSLEPVSDCFGRGEPLGMEQFQACLEHDGEHPSLNAGLQDTLRIGVEPDTAHRGWLLFVDSNPMFADDVVRAITPMDGTYLSVPAEDVYRSAGVTDDNGVPVLPESVLVHVVQVTSEYDTDDVRAALATRPDFEEAFYGSFEGVWTVELRS